MKTFFVSGSFIFIAAFATAQVTITNPEFLLPEISKPEIIGQSPYGKIYAMPLDNMPCVFLSNANAVLMPVYITPLKKAGIPNPFSVQNLFSQNLRNIKTLNLNTVNKELSKILMLNLIRKK
jgi:hypothetical protein